MCPMRLNYGRLKIYFKKKTKLHLLTLINVWINLGEALCDDFTWELISTFISEVISFLI